LGNKRDGVFNGILVEDGVKMYDAAEMQKGSKSCGVEHGEASPSKDCKPVLEAASLVKLFDTRVDGVVLAELSLKGKPEPDIFTTACDNLSVDYKNQL
jgi:beta-phosphoglucomutase-like phosphatase (HAD superfamily)